MKANNAFQFNTATQSIQLPSVAHNQNSTSTFALQDDSILLTGDVRNRNIEAKASFVKFNKW